MILQPVFSIFLRSPLPSGTWRTPGLATPWCCQPSTSSVCLVFFPLSLCLAKWFWPDLMNGKTCPYHFSLGLFTMVRRSSCGPIACWILARTSSLVTWSLYEMHSLLSVKYIRYQLTPYHLPNFTHCCEQMSAGVATLVLACFRRLYKVEILRRRLLAKS